MNDNAFYVNANSGLIQALSLEVYRMVFENPDRTANELFNLPTFRGRQIDAVRPRFAPLVRAKLIRITGERTCSISNQEHVNTYAITDHIATKADFVKQPSRQALLKRIEVLENQIREMGGTPK